jgi:hypothetical protein
MLHSLPLADYILHTYLGGSTVVLELGLRRETNHATADDCKVSGLMRLFKASI